MHYSNDKHCSIHVTDHGSSVEPTIYFGILTDFKPSKAKLIGYSGANLGNMGTIKLNCRPMNGGSPHTVKFFVTRDSKASIFRFKLSLIFELIHFQKAVYTDTSNNETQDVDAVSRIKDLRYDYKQLYKNGRNTSSWVNI